MELCRQEQGGTVFLETKETDNAYLITVSDNGIGFDTSLLPQDSSVHVGLQNVNYRLKSMCDGKLALASTPEIGTTVTINIPKAGKNYENYSCGR